MLLLKGCYVLNLTAYCEVMNKGRWGGVGWVRVLWGGGGFQFKSSKAGDEPELHSI